MNRKKEQQRIEYTKPEVVDFGPLTEAVGAFCPTGDVPYDCSDGDNPQKTGCSPSGGTPAY